MKTLHLVGAVLALLLLDRSAAAAETVTAVTEDAYPMSYARNGKVEGQATMLVEETLRRSGVDYKMELYPWARALYMASNENNILIYSIARTPERENQFKWVGEIVPIKYSFYKLRDRQDIAVKEMEDAKKYRIGVLKGDLRVKYLNQEGFKDQLEEVSNNSINLKKLEAGRIDLVPISRAGLEGLCHAEGLDCAKFEAVIDLGLPPIHLYMAFSKTTPDALVERVQNAYNKLKEEGALQRILPNFWQGTPRR